MSRPKAFARPCNSARAQDTRDRLRIPTEQLRWRCDPDSLGFASTAEIEAGDVASAQADAVEALQFGLEINAPGQNVYVRGLAGTGRTDLVKRLLNQVQPPCAPASDRCYVHDFDHPDRPALITLPRGRGRVFRYRVDELIKFVREQLLPELDGEAIATRRAELDRSLKEELQAIGAPFEEELAGADLALVMLQTQGGAQPTILPRIDGQPAPPDRLQALVVEGKLTPDDLKQIGEKIDGFSERFRTVNDALRKAREKHRDQVRNLVETQARSLLSFSVRAIESEFSEDSVAHFLEGLVDDVLQNQIRALQQGQDTTRRYQVNLLSDAEENCPVVIESQPSLTNLIGSIDRQLLPGGGAYSDHLMIKGGALLRADGGYLILEARDVLGEQGAWRHLMRTLSTGTLEISPRESLLFGASAALKPEPIAINVKVILIGDPGLYHALDRQDPDFPHLFKVLADFDTSLPREEEALRQYAGVLSRLAREEGTPHYEASAVAALAEHGARIAGRSDRLTTRFGRLGDLAREAAFLTRKAGRNLVGADDVREAIRRSRRRGDLPARRFRDRIADRTIRIDTTGRVVGQVNGLATTGAGPITYGFPARITATIGPGFAGTVDIESLANMSGSIHTKGFAILGGLLRHLLRGAGHPLAFSASIAFEQSYGGIDGDSASGAEICCLLSALTDIPLRQDRAMTGAIDQHGHVQPIGAATEKIEGFFDACSDLGLTGEQGVIIPRANVIDLMLHERVVEACAAGRFHVWAVDRIEEALEIFTGVDAGELDENLDYPAGSLLQRAVERAGDFWRLSKSGPKPKAGPAGDPVADAAERAAESAD